MTNWDSLVAMCLTDFFRFAYSCINMKMFIKFKFFELKLSNNLTLNWATTWLATEQQVDLKLSNNLTWNWATTKQQIEIKI